MTKSAQQRMYEFSQDMILNILMFARVIHLSEMA
jgi:hypothetical protein